MVCLSHIRGIIAADPVIPNGLDMGPSYARFIPVSLISGSACRRHYG